MPIYRIKLDEEERGLLLKKVKNGREKARNIQKAQVILGSDENVARQSETDLSAQYHLSVRQVQRIRKTFCLGGIAILNLANLGAIWQSGGTFTGFGM